MPTTHSNIVGEALKLMGTDCFGGGFSKGYSDVSPNQLIFNEVPIKEAEFDQFFLTATVLQNVSC